MAIDVSARKVAEQDLTRALAEVSQLKEPLEAENLLLREEIQLQQSHDELTGDGSAMRELKSRIERALIFTEGPTLRIDAPGQLPDASPRGAAEESLEAIERAHIRAILGRTGWRIRGERGAAAILGLKPTTLEYRIKKLGLKRP